MRPSVFPKIKVIKGLIIIGLHGIYGCAIQNIRMELFGYVVFYLVTMRKGGDLIVLPSLTRNTHLINLHPKQTIKNFIFYHMSNILLSETLFVPITDSL